MEKKKIKWGILGTGRIAKTLATALKVVPDSELYVVGIYYLWSVSLTSGIQIYSGTFGICSA